MKFNSKKLLLAAIVAFAIFSLILCCLDPHSVKTTGTTEDGQKICPADMQPVSGVVDAGWDLDD